MRVLKIKLMTAFRHAFVKVMVIASAMMMPASDAQVPLSLGDDFQDIIESHPAGTTS